MPAMRSAATAAPGSSGCARSACASGPPFQTVPQPGASMHQNTSASPSQARIAPGGRRQLANHARGRGAPWSASAAASAAVPGPSETSASPTAGRFATTPRGSFIRGSVASTHAGCRLHPASSMADAAPDAHRAPRVVAAAASGASAAPIAAQSGTVHGSRKRAFRCVANIQNASCATSIAASASAARGVRRASSARASAPAQNAAPHCGSHGSASGAGPNPSRNAWSHRAARRAATPVPGGAACPAAKRANCSAVQPIPRAENGNSAEPVSDAFRISQGASTAPATIVAHAAERASARAPPGVPPTIAQAAKGRATMPSAVSFAPIAAPRARPTATPTVAGGLSRCASSPCMRTHHASIAVAAIRSTAISSYARLPVTITHGTPRSATNPAACAARARCVPGPASIAATPPTATAAATPSSACSTCGAIASPCGAACPRSDMQCRNAASTKFGNAEYTEEGSVAMRRISNHVRGSSRW